MANQLVRSRTLIGTSENDLRKLLGKPDWEYAVGSAMRLSYDLVPQRSFPARSAFLPTRLFLNTDTWALQVECKTGTVVMVKIRST